MIVGVDEVGRGPWAGPVIVAAVALPTPIDNLDDSKRLSGPKRRQLAAKIKTSAHIRLAAASVREIDELNILQATMLAMTRAVERLCLPQAKVLIDGNRTPRLAQPCEAIVGGDGKVAEISAASIVAKVVRDDLMIALDNRFPGYGWARNAGYI